MDTRERVASEVVKAIRECSSIAEAVDAIMRIVDEERAELALWIVRQADERERQSKPFPVIWDSACAECEGSMIIPGFRCTVHKARAALGERR